MSGRGAFAFARKNLDRSTDDDAVVHRCVLERSELDEGKTRWRRITRPTNALTIVATRPRGDMFANRAGMEVMSFGGRDISKYGLSKVGEERVDKKENKFNTSM